MVNINEALKINIASKDVIIIGCPGSGKTYFANKINDIHHSLIHTDDYIKHGFVNSMYEALNDVIKCNNNTIVEGVQGYRLLRHGARSNTYNPDIVFELVISNDTLIELYDSKRDYDKLEFVMKMNRANDKVLRDYKSIVNNLPEWHTITNDR